MKLLCCRLVVGIGLLGLLTGCEESPALSPTGPSPLPSDKVEVLTLTCPANVVVQAQTGATAQVTYPAPNVAGGLAPVSSSCTPPSGLAFPVGTSTATCTVSDGLGQTEICSFTIEVLPPPRLAVTRLLAFGDSITAGETSVPLLAPTLLEPSKSYPFKLQGRLRQAYPNQLITVVNRGVSGEAAAAGGAARFSIQLSSVQPEVVLIMEGTIDLDKKNISESQAAAAIDSMVTEAQRRGVDPILATIAPVRPSGGSALASLVPGYNNMIRAIAAGRAIPLVDVFAVMSQGVCASSATSLPCIGQDGIHPTAEGYELIADEFFNVIMAIYDVPFVASSASPIATNGGPGSSPSGAEDAERTRGR